MKLNNSSFLPPLLCDDILQSCGQHIDVAIDINPPDAVGDEVMVEASLIGQRLDGINQVRHQQCDEVMEGAQGLVGQAFLKWKSSEHSFEERKKRKGKDKEGREK